MNKNKSWLLVAPLGFLVCVGGTATASDLRFSDLEHRLSAVERQLEQQRGVKAASYLHDDDADDSTDAAATNNNGCDSCCCNGYQACRGAYYGEAQFLFVRPHVNEDWVGKLSEEHHLSMRYVLGYEDCCGVGGRVRYWHFDHTIGILDPNRIGIQVQVIDLEATNHLYFCNTDILLAGGFRYADWKLDDQNGDGVDLDAYGLTVAGDVRTALCDGTCSRWSFLYGARLSILGGEWEGDNNIIDSVVTPEVRDDNLLVTEIYTGVEYMVRYCGYDLFARSTVEMQNWRSDVLGEPGIGNPISPNAVGSTNSIGFLGLGFHVGAGF